MKSVSLWGGLCGALLLMGISVQPLWAAGAEQNLVSKKCLRCHADYEEQVDLVAGDFINKSRKAKTIQVKVGKDSHMIKFDDETRMHLAGDLSRKVPMTVKLRESDGQLLADDIWTMPPIEIPDEQLMETAELERLVVQGPEQGQYTLVDSRPEKRYLQGHIPTAISIPFDRMHTMQDRLPENTEDLVIFYCGGRH